MNDKNNLESKTAAAASRRLGARKVLGLSLTALPLLVQPAIAEPQDDTAGLYRAASVEVGEFLGAAAETAFIYSTTLAASDSKKGDKDAEEEIPDEQDVGYGIYHYDGSLVA